MHFVRKINIFLYGYFGNLYCTPPCSRIVLAVAMEAMQFFHGAIEFIFEEINLFAFLESQ